MQPGAGVHIEVVQGHEVITLIGDEFDGFYDVVDLDIVHRVMHADPAPARFDAREALADPFPVLLGFFKIDIQQAVAVGPGTGATGTSLDSHPSVPRLMIYDQGPVFTPVILEVEGNNADTPGRILVAEYFDIGIVAPAVEDAIQ